MNEVRDPIGDARHQASRKRGMIIATSLVAAAFAAAWWRHHQTEVDHTQQTLDMLDRASQRTRDLRMPDRPVAAADDPIEAARATCRHIVDCSNAPADERADRVAKCTADRRGADSAAANLACAAVPCDQLAACLAK